MSTITYIGVGTPNTSNNGAAVTPIAHASTAVGDFVVVMASVRNSGTGVPVQPAGWITLLNFGNVSMFGRFWQLGDVAPAFTFTAGAAGDDTIALISTWRGVSKEMGTAAALTGTLLNGSAQNIAYPAFTPLKDQQLAILAAWKQSDATTITVPATMTTISSTMATAGNDATATWRYVIQTTAAAIGASSLTVTGGVSAISRALWVALKPAPTITVQTQVVYPPRVLISVTDLTLGDTVAIYRSVAGVRTLVQGASMAAVTDPSFLRVDASLPYGVAVTYIAVVNGSEYTAGPTTYTLTGGKVAISDAINALSAEVVIWAWPEKRRGRSATTFSPAGRNVVVAGDFAQPEMDVEVYTDAYSSGQNLVTVLQGATQGIVQIRQPGGYDGVDGFYAVTSYAERRWAQDGSDQKRLHSMHLVEVDGWASAFVALGTTYASLTTAYAALTYANLSADFATYLALSQWSP